MRSAAARRALLVSTAGALLGLGVLGPLPARGQAPATEASRPIDPGRFLAFAHSSAALQERASILAASKDTRPEIKEFARGMARFRGEQLGRLRAIAQERGLQLPKDEEFEHKVVLENLEPLDFLALSRRYAEVQVQALEQEIRGYEAAAQGSDEALKQLAAQTLGELRQRQEAARRMEAAVKP
jgi:putative membrane protein